MLHINSYVTKKLYKNALEKTAYVKRLKIFRLHDLTTKRNTEQAVNENMAAEAAW